MKTPCRCLLAQSGQEALARSVEEYIALLPEQARAPEPLRASRLARCTACEHLQDGTCALCGCYVEARTAKLRQRCPAPEPRW